jgi:hypothetical protein
VAQNIATCPQCGTRLDLSAFRPGQTVACPCGVHITVPPPSPGPGVPPPPGMGPAGPWPSPSPGMPGRPGAQAPPPYSAPPPVGYQTPPYAYATVPCKEANDALTMAIIGFFCFGIILGPLAIAKASKAKKMIQADPRLTGEGKATAAVVIGIIVTILSLFWILDFAAKGPQHFFMH